MLSICSMVLSSLFKIDLCVWQVQLLVLAPVWPFLISTHFLWCVRLWCKYSRHNTESLESFLTDSQMFTATLSQSSVSKNIWKGGIQHYCTLTKPKKVLFSLFFLLFFFSYLVNLPFFFFSLLFSISFNVNGSHARQLGKYARICWLDRIEYFCSSYTQV